MELLIPPFARQGRHEEMMEARVTLMSQLFGGDFGLKE